MKMIYRLCPFLRDISFHPLKGIGAWLGGKIEKMLSCFKVLPRLLMSKSPSEGQIYNMRRVKRNFLVLAILCFALIAEFILPMPTADAGIVTPDATVSDPADAELTDTPDNTEQGDTTTAPALTREWYIRMALIPDENIFIKIEPDPAEIVSEEAEPEVEVEVEAPAPDPNAVSIQIDDKTVTLSPSPLVNDSTTYVPLYDFCNIMGQAAISQDDESATVFLTGMKIVAIADNYYITANGRYLYTPTLCKKIDNVMFVPIRPLAKAFGAAVSWDHNLRTVSISTAAESFEHGDTFYNETDLYWMSRIISAEARGECMDGKIAVGNVVMNRVRSSVYPNTVRGVIFDNSCGVQFTPAYSGAINHTPNQECVIAAKLALEGVNVVGDSLFFNVARLRSWASRNRTFVTTIGNHSFYA